MWRYRRQCAAAAVECLSIEHSGRKTLFPTAQRAIPNAKRHFQLYAAIVRVQIALSAACAAAAAHWWQRRSTMMCFYEKNVQQVIVMSNESNDQSSNRYFREDILVSLGQVIFLVYLEVAIPGLLK